jgi:hypothetical protein
MAYSTGTISVAGHALPAPLAIAGFGGIFAILLLILRRALLPRPIPGIPYNKAAVTRLLGDLPEVLATDQRRAWFPAQNLRHNSPVVQIFVQPFRGPWVLVGDFREAQDIQMRRTKEFDRSTQNRETFGGIIPNNHITMRSSDPRFKGNRELIKDLMTPGFLNEVGFPRLCSAGGGGHWMVCKIIRG